MLLRFYASVGRSRLGIIVVLGEMEELSLKKQVNNIKNLRLKVIHTGGVNAYVMTLSFLLVLVTARIYGPEQRVSCANHGLGCSFVTSGGPSHQVSCT